MQQDIVVGIDCLQQGVQTTSKRFVPSMQKPALSQWARLVMGLSLSDSQRVHRMHVNELALFTVRCTCGTGSGPADRQGSSLDVCMSMSCGGSFLLAAHTVVPHEGWAVVLLTCAHARPVPYFEPHAYAVRQAISKIISFVTCETCDDWTVLFGPLIT